MVSPGRKELGVATGGGRAGIGTYLFWSACPNSGVAGQAKWHRELQPLNHPCCQMREEQRDGLEERKERAGEGRVIAPKQFAGKM